MNQLKIQRNINTNARLSHQQLTNFRRLIPKQYLQRSLDYDRINVTMLNEYLNKYAEKLSRGNAQDPYEIKVDFGKFDEILRGVEGNTYNPFFLKIDQDQEKKIEKRIPTKSRYLSHYDNKLLPGSDQINPIAARIYSQKEDKEIR